MLNFAESRHPVFRVISASERGELKSKGGGKRTVHNNGSEEIVELILRTVISVGQLSICGAVADLCRELVQIQYIESEICESLVIPTEIPNINATSQSTTSLAHGRLVARLRKEIRRTS